MKIKGTIKPLKDNVLVSDMVFGEQRTSSGIYVPGDDGKTQGIRPRWGKVWAIGDQQKEVSVGEWVLVEHGRWTRTIEVEDQNGSVIEVRMVDKNAIMLSADECPSDVQRSIA